MLGTWRWGVGDGVICVGGLWEVVGSGNDWVQVMQCGGEILVTGMGSGVCGHIGMSWGLGSGVGDGSENMPLG